MCLLLEADMRTIRDVYVRYYTTTTVVNTHTHMILYDTTVDLLRHEYFQLGAVKSRSMLFSAKKEGLERDFAEYFGSVVV